MNLKKEKELYNENKKNLFKYGLQLDSLIFNTNDYSFKSIYKTPIKYFKAKDLELNWEEKDSSYYKSQISTYYKNLIHTDIINEDWWEIGDTQKNIMYKITISTPIIITSNQIDTQIENIIIKDYFYLFGYDRKAAVLIKRWLRTNKNTKIYQIYKNNIINNNKINMNKKEMNIYMIKNNSLKIEIPFNCNITYPELFKKILNNQFKIKKEENFKSINKIFLKELKFTILKY